MQYHKTLLQILSKTEPLFRAISEAEFSFKETPERWSKKELLGHLIDSAYNNHQRFLRAEEQGNLIFRGYTQDAWVQKNHYQNRDQAELVQLWLLCNRHLAALIAGLSEDLLRRKTSEHNFHKICSNRIPEGSTSSLSYLIWDYLSHLEHHLKQLFPSYQSISGEYHDA